MLSLQQQECIRALNECASACLECATACLHSGHDSAMTRCINLDFECVELCRFTAAAIVRDSALLDSICLLCAESCEISRAECEKYNTEDCNRCAQASKKCAEACREIITQRSKLGAARARLMQAAN